MIKRMRKLRACVARMVRRRSFFIRLLVTTLIAAFIPISILSVKLIHTESQSVTSATMAQMRIAADSAADQFESYAQSMARVSERMGYDTKLKESRLALSVQNEIDALDIISSYGVGLPYVKNFALYLPASQSFYCLSGKVYINAFTRYVIGVGEGALNDMLESVSTHRFIPWDARRGKTIFISSIREGILGPPERYVIYILTPTTIADAMRTLLAGRYGIASVRDGDDNIIYENAEALRLLSDPASDYLVSEGVGERGYKVRLYASETEYLKNAESIAANARRLAWMIIALCLALIVMVVPFNYRPLAQLVRHAHNSGAQETASELDSLYTSYTRLAEEKSSLSGQLYEKMMFIADKTIENLLSGRKVTPAEIRPLRLNMPYYRVVCAPLNRVTNAAEIIARNIIGAQVYAIEIYEDGRLAFICGLEDYNEVAPLSDKLRELLKSRDIPLGYSTAYEAPERLFMAYLEAGRALAQESQAADRFIERAMGQEIHFLKENTLRLEELMSAVKSGDEYMLEFARRSFDEIEKSAPSAASQRYVYYQLIEIYRRACEPLGVGLDMGLLSQMLMETDMDSVRGQFMSMLENIRDERLRYLSQAKEYTDSSIMSYVRENFTNPAFSMNDVADYLGVSIYTASRILKTLIGVNFRKYLNDMRVERAKELLLTTELSISDISLKSGFASSSYFNKVFKESENVTPNSYRWDGQK